MHNDARRAFVERLQNDRMSVPVCNECEFGPPGAPSKSFRQMDPKKAEREGVDPVRIVDAP